MLDKLNKTTTASLLNQQPSGNANSTSRSNPLKGMDFKTGTEALSTNKDDPKKKKTKKKDKEEEAKTTPVDPQEQSKTIDDISTRIQQCFYDQDYFVEVWSVYDPNRTKLTSKQELQLTQWVQFHRGGQTSAIKDQFYEFLAYYYTTFKADPEFDPGKGIIQTKEMVALQMWIDDKATDAYDVFRQYNLSKLTSKQESFVKKVVNAGFSETLFFQWLEHQMM